MPLLEVNGLSKTFSLESGIFGREKASVRALDDVSLTLDEGKVLGVVGESGSGKSTLGRILCRLMPRDSGTVTLDGKDLDSYDARGLSEKIQLVFQDPFMSLNPRLSAGAALEEAALQLPKKERSALAASTLAAVGLDEGAARFYPHQFSGGQRQRIAIARALIKRPKLIVADEPLSALDLTIQNQLLDLFAGLRKQYGTAFIFISHDITVTAEISDCIIVMQNGKIVESGPTASVMSSPAQDYTKRLLAAAPRIG